MKVLMIISLFFINNAQANMDKTQCSEKVIEFLKVIQPQADNAQTKLVWEAICEGFIEHIKEAAVVSGPCPSFNMSAGKVE